VYVESGYSVVWVSMRIVLRGGPPPYTILVRSCVSQSDRVIINQVKQKLHLVGYLLIQYFKDARYHEHQKFMFAVAVQAKKRKPKTVLAYCLNIRDFHIDRKNRKSGSLQFRHFFFLQEFQFCLQFQMFTCS